MVTASLTTPAIVTVTALVTETKMYSVSTCKKIKISVGKNIYRELKNMTVNKQKMVKTSVSPKKGKYTPTIKKARVPPKNISKQLRVICHELLKYSFSRNSSHGSKARERSAVATAITGVT